MRVRKALVGWVLLGSGCHGVVLERGADDGGVRLDAQEVGLGADAHSDVTGPPLVLDATLPPGSVRSVATGQYHTCAILADKLLRCWGSNSHGQLGFHNTSAHQFDPRFVEGLPPVTSVAACQYTTCALSVDDEVWCMGMNYLGQLGDGTLDGDLVPGNPTPRRVPGMSNVRALAAGENHFCVALIDGTAECWGANWSGSLGSFWGGPGPSVVPGVQGAVDLALGYNSSCALLSSGEVMCWGKGVEIGLAGNAAWPPTKVPLPPGAIQLGGGRWHYCASFPDGSVWCWGFNFNHQLALPSALSSSPVPLPGLDPVLRVFDGHASQCVGLVDGTLRCWGQLDDSLASCGWNADAPIEVNGFDVAGDLESGPGHVCAGRIDGSVVCMGQNGYGQVGNGGADCHTPAAVIW